MNTDNNALFEELRTNTQSNIMNRRIRQELEKQQHDERLAYALDCLTTDIESECVEKMKAASNEGHYYATLYSFTNNDIFDNYKTVFLLKGPFRGKNVYGLLFYEQKGLVPIITRLNTKYAPIEFFMKYDRNTKTHHILASWKGVDINNT